MIADDTVIFNSVYLYKPTITAASRCLNMKKKKVFTELYEIP